MLLFLICCSVFYIFIIRNHLTKGSFQTNSIKADPPGVKSVTKMMKILTLLQSQILHYLHHRLQISTNDTKIKVIDVLHNFSDNQGKKVKSACITMPE